MTAQRASTLLFLLFITALCVAGFRSPSYNWDLLGYMGAAIAWDTPDAGAIHALTYETARAQLPPDAFSRLIDSSDILEREYRQDLFRNPAHFVQQLPYYQVRPAYIALIYGLHNAGLPLTRAVIAVSTAAYAGLALLLFAWLGRHLAAPFAALTAALLALSAPMLGVLRLASPDALSALVLVAAFFLLLETDRTRAAAALLLASIFVRNDNVLLVMMVLGLLAFDHARLQRRELVVLAAAAIGSYLVINAWSGHYGWATLFYHSFAAFVPDPAEREIAFQPALYVSALWDGARSAVGGSMIAFALVGIGALLLPPLRAGSRMAEYVLLLLAGNMALRFLLFPAVWDRFFVTHYVVASVILIVKLVHHLPVPEWLARTPGVAYSRRVD